MSLIDVVAERPVAGGRMLAHHEGGIVLVSGTLPGERVQARLTKASRRISFAETVTVIEPSPDRRSPPCDPACGGASYAHVRYARQLELKVEIVRDAFRRIGRITLDQPLTVAASPETGYRLRATLHARHGRLGFYREGTRQVCDAASTGQLLPESTTAVAALVTVLGPRLEDCGEVVVCENIAATERVLHLRPRDGRSLTGIPLDLAALDGVTGVTAATRRRLSVLVGAATVSDSAEQVFGETSPVSPLIAWTRHPTSFFQGNRFLLGALARRVLDAAAGERVVDLYAGVGVFAVALASRGTSVVAVEGDPSAGADLLANAGPWRDRLLVVRSSVEAAVADPPAGTPDVVIVDPPRTGMSTDALTGVLAWQVPKVVYVSCDPPTIARDAARLIEAGYTLDSIEGFDLFPNTPHVEVVAVFTQRSQSPAEEA